MATILVVDDDADNREVIRRMLRLGGHTSVMARDGMEAMEKLSESLPDLILMDLSMPNMDGWSATSQIKADQRLTHIPVIAVTAHAMSEDTRRALDAGCDAYLAKPLDYKALLKLIASHLPEPAQGAP